MRNIVLIAHNLRSCHNVGSLLRTADGLGVKKVYLTGYTPYPMHPKDNRLPHIALKLHNKIQKTALGAEQKDHWEYFDEINPILNRLKKEKFIIVALEQSNNSVQINKWNPPSNIAIVLGRETFGIEQEVLDQCNIVLEIPMFGRKESFNVVQAAAMALFYTRFTK